GWVGCCFFFFQAEDGIRYWSVTGVQTCALPISRLADVRVSGGVLAFTLGASLLASLLFGLSPAWQAARAGAGDALKRAGRGIAGDRKSGGEGKRGGLGGRGGVKAKEREGSREQE